VDVSVIVEKPASRERSRHERDFHAREKNHQKRQQTTDQHLARDAVGESKDRNDASSLELSSIDVDFLLQKFNEQWKDQNLELVCVAESNRTIRRWLLVEKKDGTEILVLTAEQIQNLLDNLSHDISTENEIAGILISITV